MGAPKQNYPIRVSGWSRREGKPTHKGYEISIPIAIIRTLGDYRRYKFTVELTDEGILYRPVKSERSSDHEQSGDQASPE